MPELLNIVTKNYDLAIWSKDVCESQKRYSKTIRTRGNAESPSAVIFNPAICINGSVDAIHEHVLPKAVFFENKQYDIEFVFKHSVETIESSKWPRIEHRLRAVEDSFHFSTRTNALRATINTGNDIGWFKLKLAYRVNGSLEKQSFSFEVLPTKMDMNSDLRIMTDAIDSQYPLWRFALAEKTSQNMKAVKMPHDDFLLLWLAQFESLTDELSKGLKHIFNAPHSRLLPVEKAVKLEKLKGKLSSRIEEGVVRAMSDQNLSKTFNPNHKVLSVDTPENRFIKFVVLKSISKLSKIKQSARAAQIEPDKQRLSESFFCKLDNWLSGLQKFNRQPVFSEVGAYRGSAAESLVLQQKPGYAKVYKVWQKLKWYLEMLDGRASLSMRSVAELYEVWCFIEVLDIVSELGFVKCKNKPIPMVNGGTRVDFKDGLQGAFHFRRDDGISLRVAHEPRFQKGGSQVKTWTTPQKPDIWLEASFPDRQKFVWIFDAKYRVQTIQTDSDTEDLVPDDAINQMHRYRDALIHIDRNAGVGTEQKSRPILGAYALYPGFFDQAKEENPYQQAIEEVGIGAFSLLPSSDKSGSLWLKKFISDKLARKTSNYGSASSDSFFVEEAPRIPYRGTRVTRFNDLVITANQVGPNRTEAYLKAFINGDARYYHSRQWAFERQSIEVHVILESRFLSCAVDTLDGAREIKFLYPIIEATRVKRSQINVIQAGTETIKDPDEIYWLFKLGQSLELKRPVRFEIEDRFRIKLLSRQDLTGTANWDQLVERYRSLRS